MGLGTVFVIGVTTARMIMPGIPEIPGMKAMDLNAPTKTLTMNLTSDKKVNEQSKAECAVPEGLKLGPKVDLFIDLPKPVAETEGDLTGNTAKFVIKMYWSCGEAVPEGQPRVIDSDKLMSGKDMSPKDMERMRKGIQMAIVDSGKSHAYWPGPDSKKIQKDSVTPGSYTLTTNYCGGTSITFDEPQNFLAAIDMVSPKGSVDLEKTIKVEWKAVPNAQAYLLTAFAGNDKQMVMWTSSADPDNHADLEGRALSKQQLETLLENGVLLPPTKTNCRIPAGIFKDMGNPMLMVTAFGTDKIQAKDGIETQVVVRSNATVMLGGPEMGEMEADVQAADDSDADETPEVKQTSSKEPAEDEKASSGDDTGSEIADAAKDETKEQTKETVRDTVRKVFGKLRKK